MTKQPLKVRNHLANLKSMGIILPDERNPLQLWILVVLHPFDNNPGEVFVTHGKNFEKFKSRKGFEVIGHSHDRGALTLAARKLTASLGPQYTPKFSAARNAKPGAVLDEPSESQLVDSDIPDDFLDAVGEHLKSNN